MSGRSILINFQKNFYTCLHDFDLEKKPLKFFTFLSIQNTVQNIFFYDERILNEDGSLDKSM